MKSCNTVTGPRLASLSLASCVTEYLRRAQELGAVESVEGGVELHPHLKPILEGLHHVLAGGEVEVRVVHRGHPDIVQELDRRAQQATQAANAVNQAAGFYLTAAV